MANKKHNVLLLWDLSSRDLIALRTKLVNKTKFAWALKSFKPNKSSEPDGIFLALLSHKM